LYARVEEFSGKALQNRVGDVENSFERLDRLSSLFVIKQNGGLGDSSTRTASLLESIAQELGRHEFGEVQL
jgi:hypothetical protein